MIEDALVAHAKAVSLRLEVLPGSKEPGIRGYDEWRKRVRVSLKEEARGGAANKELLRLVSDLFGVDRDRVGITEGIRSRRKTVTVHSVSVDEAIEALRREMR
jgi:uncharacterized protein (TIGR00251 family)